MGSLFRHLWRTSLFAVALLCASLPATVLADTSSELWDATTLDLNHELSSLDGTWQFVPWDSLTLIPDFKDATPVQVPVAGTPGAYHRRFVVSSEMGTRRVILHFGAVAYRAAIFVNGQLVGTHAGGFTPFEFDVTEYSYRGENELTVLVQGLRGAYISAEPKTSASQTTFNERAQAVTSGGDKVAFGWGYFAREGIRQSVFLREAPLLRVTDTTIVTSFRNQQFEATVNLSNESGASRRLDVQVEVLPYDIATGRIGAAPVWTSHQAILAAPGGTSTRIVQPWKNPKPWMPGDPHLYVARIRLLDAGSRGVLHERNIRFGFREVWTSGRKIIINGKPFRGFTHGTLDTEAAPDAVRALFRQMMDVGINTVRPSTMPPAPYYCQIADEMGMGIIGEGELTFNPNFAFDEPIFWENFERLHRERMARDKNHPSILLISLANEVICSSPNQKIGERFYQSFLRLKAIDPTRPFMQEGDGDLRDQLPDTHGWPIDIVNLHLYDVSPHKNPLWATEFPSVAWALETITSNQEMPGAIKSGVALPDRNRPWYIGEFGPAVTIAYPDFFSSWTGPEAYRDLFGDAHELVRGIGETVTLQLQAFRDIDMAGMDPWDMPENPVFKPYLQRALEPITVFARDKKAHAWSGEKTTRRLTVLNDSFQAKNLILTAVLKQGERELSRERRSFLLAPGAKRVLPATLTIPQVRARTGLHWKVLLQDESGKTLSGLGEIFLVYPTIRPSQAWQQGRARLYGDRAQLGALARWTGEVLRPPAQLLSRLRSLDAAHVPLIVLDKSAFSELGKNAEALLSPYIASGGVVLALGADAVSLDGISLAANPESVSTRTFISRRSTLIAGTDDADWEFWQRDHFVSRGNYEVSFDPRAEFPLVGGGRNGLLYSPLAVLPHEKGALIGCRLQLNQAIESEPVARIFLNNLVAYAQERQRPRPVKPRLNLICAPSERLAWKARLQQAHIPLAESSEVLIPRQNIVLLSGDAVPTAAELTRLKSFVTDGGTLWLHRLSPQTAYLKTVGAWLGDPLQFKTPPMWLQQFELAASQSTPALLDGINDFHTCWATFGWTNGNAFSVRTTPIANYSLTNLGPRAKVLLKEANWIGRWDISENSGTLSQKILRDLGKHDRNENPGVGLAEYSVGRGRLILDQLRWDDVMMNETSESRNKARYLAGTLWKNLAQ